MLDSGSNRQSLYFTGQPGGLMFFELSTEEAGEMQFLVAKNIEGGA